MHLIVAAANLVTATLAVVFAPVVGFVRHTQNRRQRPKTLTQSERKK